MQVFYSTFHFVKHVTENKALNPHEEKVQDAK